MAPGDLCKSPRGPMSFQTTVCVTNMDGRRLGVADNAGGYPGEGRFGGAGFRIDPRSLHVDLPAGQTGGMRRAQTLIPSSSPTSPLNTIKQDQRTMTALGTTFQ